MVGLIERIRFWWSTNRIGPDIPLTHWMLYFQGPGRWLATRKLARFGSDSAVRPFVYLVATHHIEIGSRVVVRPNSMLMADDDARIVIGDDVLMGAGVHIYVNNHKYDRKDRTIISQGYDPSEDVIIEDDVWIGANAIILQGVTIGRHSVVAAGSVVTRSVEANTVYGGVPAKKIKDI